MDYEKQAYNFLNATDSTIDIQYKTTGKHFDDDKEERDVYTFTIKRRGRSYSSTFGDSINNTEKRKSAEEAKDAIKSKGRYTHDYKRLKEVSMLHEKPGPYDILTCLTKYDPSTFEDFCSEYGYDNDSIRAKKTYEAVRDEYLNLAKLYSPDELEKMSEIQ